MIEQNCSASKWKSNWKLEMYEMKTLLFQNVIPLNLMQLFQSSNKMWDMNTMYVSCEELHSSKRQVIVTSTTREYGVGRAVTT